MTRDPWARQRPWALAVGDQALSSLGNLVLTVGVARAASREQLGALAIALLPYGLVLGISRSLCTDPFTVLHGGREDTRVHTGQLLSAVLAIGTVSGALVAAAAAIPGLPSATLIALAVLLPLLLLVDACRYVGFARGAPGAALLVDGIWTAGVVVAVLLLSVHGTSEAAPFVWLWGAAALPALLVGVVRLDLRMGRGAAEWFRRSRHLGRPVTGQFLAETGAMQVANLLVAATAGLGGAASVRVAVTVFAPVSVLLGGLRNVLLPRLSTRPITGDSSRQLVAKVTALALSASVAYLVLVHFLPDRTGMALFGPSWSPSTPLLLGYGVFIVGTALVIAPARALLGAGYARLGLTIALFLLPVMLLGPVVGYLLLGTAGIGWGFASVGALSVALWGQQYVKRSRPADATSMAILNRRKR